MVEREMETLFSCQNMEFSAVRASLTPRAEHNEGVKMGQGQGRFIRPSHSTFQSRHRTATREKKGGKKSLFHTK